jgi:itaconate CoA-transferase
MMMPDQALSPRSDLPLDGLLVVSVEQAVAAPLATRQLAELGARVIKVEPRDGGDFARRYDAAFGEVSSYFAWLNRGKESICLDLADEGDRSDLRRLIARADVFVQNLSPETAERHHLGAEQLSRTNPTLIACDIRGYAASSPDATRKAYDLLIQCESGLAALTGSADEPARVGVSIADIATGMYAFAGILVALKKRDDSGRGEALSVAMFDAMAEWLSQPAFYAWQTGQAPSRTGLHHATIAPYGAFRVADGTVAIGVQNESQWRRFCDEVLGVDDLADDPSYATNVARVAHRTALDELVQVRLASRTVADLCARLTAADVPYALVRSVGELKDALLADAEPRLTHVPGPSSAVWAIRPPVRFASFDALMGAVPAVGEHTADIRAEFDLERVP